MRFTFASLSVLALAGASLASSPAEAAVFAPAHGQAVDAVVPRLPNSAVSFDTFPSARCVLGSPGTKATMTVYADERGTVAFHVTPARGGVANASIFARCDARGEVMTKTVRLHVVARAPRPLIARPTFGARLPLVPRGVNPATLTEADLKRLQLPPRPDAGRDPKNYADWLRAVTTPVTRVPGNAILRPDRVHGPVRLTGMRRPHAARGLKNGYYSSNNWSGIVDFGAADQFTYWVAGKWTVPAVDTDMADSPAYSSIWDGIDGWGSGDVIQNGTEQDAFNLPLFGSLNFYSAWYEFYPDGGSSTLPNFSVNPGDDIYAASWLCYDGNGNRYGCYYMENMTQGEASPVYSELGQQPGLFQGNSAEWITERPTVNGGLSPLPDFGAFPFWWEHVYDSYAGAGYNACDENENVVTMFNAFDALASAYTTSCDSSESYWNNFQ